jgi:Dolichyl-phosphate-mannose-protein mannosyltransferase
MSSVVHEKSDVQTDIETQASNPSGLIFSYQQQIVAILLFLFSFAYLCIFRRHSSLEPDEGIVLQGAERILRGEVPYRDFFTFYTPGSFYFLAVLFKFFGDSWVVARTSIAVAGAVSALTTFLLARRVCSLGAALFAGLLATVAGCAYRFLVLHNWYSTAVCGLCLYAAIRLYETQRSAWGFAVGFLAALTFVIEQSKGAGLCAGIVLGFVILGVANRALGLRKRLVMAMSLGFVFPLLLTMGFFASQHSLSIMVHSWLWPLRHYTRANQVPYGWQNWSAESINIIFHDGPLWLRVMKVIAISPGLLVPLIPIVAIGVLLYWTLQLRHQTTSKMGWYYVLIGSVLCGLLLSVVTVRADVIHFMYLAPMWYIVLGWMFGSVLRNGVWVAMRPYLIMYVALAFGLLGLVLLLRATGAHIRIPTRRGIIIVSKHDTVLEFVQTHTSPGQPLLIYPYRPLYNYLTATRNPTSFDYFQPGMNTETQALKIVAALKSQPPSAILFEPWFPEKIANSWPGTPLGAIANDQAGDYIVNNYHVCRVLYSADDSEFEFMVSKGAMCP